MDLIKRRNELAQRVADLQNTLPKYDCVARRDQLRALNTITAELRSVNARLKSSGAIGLRVRATAAAASDIEPDENGTVPMPNRDFLLYVRRQIEAGHEGAIPRPRVTVAR